MKESADIRGIYRYFYVGPFERRIRKFIGSDTLKKLTYLDKENNYKDLNDEEIKEFFEKNFTYDEGIQITHDMESCIYNLHEYDYRLYDKNGNLHPEQVFDENDEKFIMINNEILKSYKDRSSRELYYLCNFLYLYNIKKNIINRISFGFQHVCMEIDNCKDINTDISYYRMLKYMSLTNDFKLSELPTFIFVIIKNCIDAYKSEDVKELRMNFELYEDSNKKNIYNDIINLNNSIFKSLEKQKKRNVCILEIFPDIL